VPDDIKQRSGPCCGTAWSSSRADLDSITSDQVLQDIVRRRDPE
jgi:hypothetical protein